VIARVGLRAGATSAPGLRGHQVAGGAGSGDQGNRLCKAKKGGEHPRAEAVDAEAYSLVAASLAAVFLAELITICLLC
jgi:hypothetical protein